MIRDEVLTAEEVEGKSNTELLSKHIIELQADKGRLTDQVYELKDRLNEEIELHQHAEDYIKSLEAQIEKMKRCSICKYSTDLGYCKIRCNGGECNNMDKWEIKENDRK